MKEFEQYMEIVDELGKRMKAAINYIDEMAERGHLRNLDLIREFPAENRLEAYRALMHSQVQMVISYERIIISNIQAMTGVTTKF